MGQIHFDISVYFLFLFAILSTGLSYLMYRKIEEINKPKRVFLFVLRSISFLLLFLAITNLTTDIIHTFNKKHDVLVLVDDSKSMSLFDGTVQRASVVKNLIRSKTFHDLSEQFHIKPVVFGGDVLHSNDLDSLKFNQPLTNIESSLEEVSRLGTDVQPAFAILLTDGNYNAGGNPIDFARTLSFPIYSVGIGDSTQPKDIVARKVIPAPSEYAGKKSIVRAVIGSYGFGGKSVRAELLEDGKQVDSKEIRLASEGNIEVSFDYTPKTVGTHVLTVHVQSLNGEFDQRNNSTTASVEVLKGKYSVLLVAGEPTSDVAFLRRNLESVQEFELKFLIQKDAGSFYQQIASGIENISNDNANQVLAQKYDAVLLYDFPNSQSGRLLPGIQGVLNSSGLPYAYFAGENFSPEQVGRLPRLPFAVHDFSPGSSGGEFQVAISPASSGESPMANLQPLYALLDENSSLIPPLYYQKIECTPSYGAISIAYPVLSGVRMTSPIFLVSETGRSAAFLAYGLWRVQLMSSISGLRSDFLREFLATLIRNLINSGKQRLLTVNTDKKNYDPSETINFLSLLVDQTGSPVNDAVIDVNIENEVTRKSVSDLQMNRNDNGSYAGSLSGLGEGKYSYYVNAKSGSGFLGADSGTIVVESMNTEFIQTSMNAQLLKQLSSVTGGKFLTPQEFISGNLPIRPEWREPVSLTSERKYELLSSLPILVIVFVLLGVEWVMRKIWGLP